MGFWSNLFGGAEEASDSASDSNSYESWHSAINATRQSQTADYLAQHGAEQWVIDELRQSAENLANKACDVGNSGSADASASDSS